MPNSRAVARSILWNHAGKILEYALSYVASVLIARSLGVEGNGVYAGIISASQLLFALSSVGFETSLNTNSPRFDGDPARMRFVVRRMLLFRFLIIVTLGILGVAALPMIPGGISPAVGPYVWLLLSYAVVRSLIPLYVITFVAHLRTDLNARISLAVRLVELGAIVFLSGTGLTIGGLLLLMTATGALHIVIATISGGGLILGKSTPVPLKPILFFGAVFWVNTIVDFFLGRQGDIMLLSSLLADPRGASAYDVAYSLMQMATLGATVGLTGVTLATFSRLALSAPDRLDAFYHFMVRIVSLVTLPLYAFLIANAESLVTVIYSGAYVSSVLPLQIMAGFRFGARLFGGGENAEFLLSTGRVRILTIMGIIAAAANIGVDVGLIPRYGVEGAAMGGGVGTVVANALTVAIIVRVSTCRIQFGYWALIGAVSIVSAGIVSFAIDAGGIAGLAVRGVLFAVCYLSALYMVKPFSDLDAEWLSSIDPRLSGLVRSFSRKTWNDRV